MKQKNTPAQTSSATDLPASHGPMADLPPLRLAAHTFLPGDSRPATAAAKVETGTKTPDTSRRYSPW